MQYVKLFSSILHSTIWREALPTKVVWITLLVMADKEGEVHASIPGIAATAGVTVEECRAAIKSFLSPDPDSRTKDFDGRRLEEIDGGWQLLNHAKYRHLLSKENRRERDAERQRRRRQRQRDSHAPSRSVTLCHTKSRQAEAETDSEAEKEEDPPLPPQGARWDENRFVVLYLAWFRQTFRTECSLKPKPWDPAVGKLTLLAGSEDGFSKHFRRAAEDHYVLKSAGKLQVLIDSWDEIAIHGPRDEFKNPIKPRAAKRRPEPVPAVLRPVEPHKIIVGPDLAEQADKLLESLTAGMTAKGNGGHK